MGMGEVRDDALLGMEYGGASGGRGCGARWSPDGSAIAYLKIDGFEAKRPLIPERTQSWSIWIGDSRTYKSRELWKSGKALRDSLPHFATESQQFAAGNRGVFDSGADGWSHWYSIAADGCPGTCL